MIEIIGYEEVLSKAKVLFTAENGILPPVWTVMRLSTIADILYQHTKRLKYHLDTKIRCDMLEIPYSDIYNEFLFVINYAVIGHIQLTHGSSHKITTTAKGALEMYDASVELALNNFNKDTIPAFTTVSYFYECIEEIINELRLHNGARKWDLETDTKRFLDTIVYGICGDHLVA